MFESGYTLENTNFGDSADGGTRARLAQDLPVLMALQQPPV